MYSKPKGLYVKQRDRPVRRPSPRSSDELKLSLPSPRSDSSGPSSPEVQVESYGDGHIRANSEELWPKRDFEQEAEPSKLDDKSHQAANEPQPSTSTANYSLPERAQKYMVKSDSYKDLKRAKFITVPEPNSTAKAETIAVQRSTHGSIRSFGQLGFDTDFPVSSTPRNFQPQLRLSATHRGIPRAVSNRHSHIATIRVHPKHYKLKSHMHTVKPIPHNGTVHTVKGYHLGHNATVRAHNTGHAVKQLKHAITSWDKPDGTFKRNTYLTDRKEYYISQFAIELDRAETDIYTAGDVLSGRIVLEVLSNIEIRFVELLIVGVASVQFSKHDPLSAKNAQDVLLNKRSYVMGTADGRWNSVITAGKYLSRFKFKLPDNLPSTVKYENKESGFSFEVGYLVKARICDEMGSSSLRSTHSTNTYVKVLLTRRFPFMVRQPFDIHAIPKALQPISHSEIVNINCLPICIHAASMSLSMERSVFLAGDEIRVKLITSGSTAHKIKSLTCELQQHIHSNIKTRQNYTVVQVYVHEPKGLVFKEKSQTFSLFEFIVPTQSNFVPSFLPGIKLLKVTYSIMMTVKFNSCSGKLFLQCPIGIGPCANHMTQTETTTVPVFNRPIRFPHFSRDSQKGAKTQNGTAHSGGEENQVNTTYKPQGAQLLCCCMPEEDF